jgi:hypothetical protein
VIVRALGERADVAGGRRDSAGRNGTLGQVRGCARPGADGVVTLAVVVPEYCGYSGSTSMRVAPAAFSSSSTCAIDGLP